MVNAKVKSLGRILIVSPPDHKSLVTRNTNSWQWRNRPWNSSVINQIGTFLTSGILTLSLDWNSPLYLSLFIYYLYWTASDHWYVQGSAETDSKSRYPDILSKFYPDILRIIGKTCARLSLVKYTYTLKTIHL